MKADFRSIITVTLNPTIDRIIEVPGFTIGGHQQGKLRVREPAGKAINVSRALSVLGIQSTAVGWVGMNAFDLFDQAMRRAGVKACFLPITGATRENITIIDPQARLETHIRDAGPSVDSSDIRRLMGLMQTVVTAGSLVIFTGSLPPGFGMDAWNRLLKACSDRGALLAVDTDGEALRSATENPLWMIKPNEYELAELLNASFSDEPSLVRAGCQLNNRFPVVLVTVGRKGAYCFADGRVLHARASVASDQVRSTVGCGDAMTAGFLAGLMSDGNIETALREGVVISAAAAMTEEPARFEPHRADHLRRAVQFRAIS